MSLVRQRDSANAIPSPPAGRAMAYAAYTALAWAIVVASLIAAPGWTGAFGAGLGLLMAAIAVKDGRSFAIPNKLSFAAFALGLANAANETFESIPENIFHAAVRGILLALAFYLFRAIYFRLRHRHGLGLGDAKLAAAAGAWLDWALIPTAIELAALAALAIYAVSRLLQRRPFNPAAKLPFGLFFAPAIWVCWLVEAISLKP
jgi:leader peptidase (prepilin peptidase) / N-methyltransferase